MNCKPGDLAVIIKDKYSPADIGKIVEVLHEGEHEWEDAEGFHWYVRSVCGPMEVRVYVGEEFSGNLHYDHEAHIPDSCLKPIRDPGEDATDETLEWLPVPTTKKETSNA
jgi:hypothetical protein